MEYTQRGAHIPKVLAHLEEHGKAAVPELAKLLGLSLKNTNQVCRQLTRPLRVKGGEVIQRAHVGGWDWHGDGVRNYPRPVFHAGPGVNQPRPKARGPLREVTRRILRNIDGVPSSVFELGLKPRQLSGKRAVIVGATARHLRDL
jgi:hypothetical protein